VAATKSGAIPDSPLKGDGIPRPQGFRAAPQELEPVPNDFGV
jgi:hypothetical protein